MAVLALVVSLVALVVAVTLVHREARKHYDLLTELDPPIRWRQDYRDFLVCGSCLRTVDLHGNDPTSAEAEELLEAHYDLDCKPLPLSELPPA